MPGQAAAESHKRIQMIQSLFLLFLLALASTPALALWSAGAIPVKVRALLVTVVIFISSIFVISKFLKRLDLRYGDIGVRLPQAARLKEDLLLFAGGTLACLLWFRLYLGAFKALLPTEYARIGALKYSGYIQFLTEWGRTGGLAGAAALCGGMLLMAAMEELTFRGVIFNLLRREHSLKGTLLWSSALFTLVHLNPHNFPISFGVGLILGLLYVKSGGLAVPVSAHLAYNLAVIYLGRYLH